MFLTVDDGCGLLAVLTPAGCWLSEPTGDAEVLGKTWGRLQRATVASSGRRSLQQDHRSPTYAMGWLNPDATTKARLMEVIVGRAVSGVLGPGTAPMGTMAGTHFVGYGSATGGTVPGSRTSSR
ncbi:UNVERIFIED_CONTAM: hypothetical protein FKN15_017931 [Acipenser sinensis]